MSAMGRRRIFNLEREGIATAQGYLYCRPLPLDDICAFLDRERRAVSKAA
jgi:EAL domain-containing protein (putative c-di-GMP-specific phosphodiesterase class I)